MSYWIREIAGWILIAVGIIAFYNVYEFLLRKRIFEAVPLAFVGFVIFRGGIHLLKVAVAAQAARKLKGEPAPTAKRPRTAVRQIGPTAAKNVLPGPQNPPRQADAEPAAAVRRRE